MKAERQPKEPQKAEPIQSKRERTKLGFIDNRTQIAIQTKLLKLIQKKDSTDSNLIQRMVQVYVEYDDPTKKKIRARGKVKDFKNGTPAGVEGWIGVTSYRSSYEIGDEEDYDTDEVGPLKNTFTTPEAGHVLARQNGGDGADSDNVFAQDGGTNNSTYKNFENKMRGDLNSWDENANVKFTTYLKGISIEKGNIAEEALSDASSISSEDSDTLSEDGD